MKEVTLKNGALVPDMVLIPYFNQLKDLFKNEFMGFQELVELCRNRDYVVCFDITKLRNAGFIESDGQPHPAVRDIVLNAVEGEGFDMMIVDPRKKEE